MDEAALCDRIALIQEGKILEIDTPENIVKYHPKTIYNVSSNNTYQLIQDLKEYPGNQSVFAFGEFIHYTDVDTAFNPEDLHNYLTGKNHQQVEIHPAKVSIEDVFMDLASQPKTAEN